MFCFHFGTACGTFMFAVATGTTISSNLGRQFGLLLSLPFFDVYSTNPSVAAEPIMKWYFKVTLVGSAANDGLVA